MNGDEKVHDGLPAGLANLGDWVISEFTNPAEGLTLRGQFRLSPFNQLDQEQTRFLTTFLRCRGVLSSVEKELGLSYPTVRARLDALLKALGLHPTEELIERTQGPSAAQQEILEKLEAGEMTPEEAKQKIKEAV